MRRMPSGRLLWTLVLPFVLSVVQDVSGLPSLIEIIAPLQRSQRLAHRNLAFGDYAEIPATCPATTTCPIVCVANVTECPNACEDGKVLCNDGFCEDSCDDEIESPCLCDDLKVVCPKVINLYDACFDDFQAYYDADLECQEAQAAEIPQLSFTGPIFLFCYFWISGVTLLVPFWCFFNHKISPVEGSALSLADTKASAKGDLILTGYKTHCLGTMIYASVVFTFLGIQFLLLFLTIMYYTQQEAILTWPPVFYDEVQVLLAFIIVWMVGFFWCFILLYPGGIRNMFMRRCALRDATHVAVVAPAKKVTKIPGFWHTLIIKVISPFDCFLRTLFSTPSCPPGFTSLLCPVNNDPQSGTQHFYHRMKRYVYDELLGTYVVGIIDLGTTFADFMNQADGLSNDQVIARRGVAGPNIILMEKPGILRSIIKEFSKPFYLYQNFMVWSWAPYWYYYMAILNTCVRLTGGLVVSSFQYMSDSVLYQISHVEGEVEVLRDGYYTKISATDVVPGDVTVLVPGKAVCDMLVLSSEYVLVDESALTGESTPVGKQELDPAMKTQAYSPGTHKSVTIFAGTHILEVGENKASLGLVLKTGSFTSKGAMLSDVLSYERHPLKFDDEVKIVLLILVLDAIFLIGMVFYFLQEQWVYAWFYGMYVVVAILPPLLPTVFVVSVGISANRLFGKNISCTNPEGILVAGKVDAAFFDKTGTLTKDGMDFLSCDTYLDNEDKVIKAKHEGMLSLAMAVCHGLSFTNVGEVTGNQVDKASFESSGAVHKKDLNGSSVFEHDGSAYSVLKHFVFDTHRATQTVIVEDDTGAKFVITKGSPEAISRLCIGSTVPENFKERVAASAKSGVYQIAVGFHNFKNDRSIAEVRRDDIEKELDFCGVINFQNTLKEASPGVIRELEEGSTMVSIITGDSVLTGICIAREAGLIKPNRKVLVGSKDLHGDIEWIDVDSDERLPKTLNDVEALSCCDIDLAVTGDAWTALLESDPKCASSIGRRVRVFGRCNPTDKVVVVSHFIENGLITLMCGDGQNDCGALKAAHVGISLSTSEASIVSPFTSIDKDIAAVTVVLREGRCALASALAAYKYYILYGQIEAFLQTTTAYFSVTFDEWCWVFLDGIWSITMAFSLPLSKAAKRLSPIRPTASLLGSHTMFSACGLLAWNILFMIIALLALFSQDWFQCRKWNSNDVSDVLAIGDNYETATLFVVGGYQYVASAIALNFGYTFRESWWKNYIFVFLSFTWTLFQFVMTLYPSSFSCIWRVNCSNEMVVRSVTDPEPMYIQNPWNTTVFPESFRWILVAIMTCNVLTLCAWEYFFVNGILHKSSKKSAGLTSETQSQPENELSGHTLAG